MHANDSFGPSQTYLYFGTPCWLQLTTLQKQQMSSVSKDISLAWLHFHGRFHWSYANIVVSLRTHANNNSPEHCVENSCAIIDSMFPPFMLASTLVDNNKTTSTEME